MNPATLPYLRHPHTREPLILLQDRLVAQETGETFPICDGIPSFVLPERTPFTHRFWEWVYNRIAFAYDWGADVAWKHKFGGQPIERRAYLEKIQIQPGAAVLETAAGTGTNILALPGHARFFGLDISLNMLRRCQRNLAASGREAELIHGDAQVLPFGDDLFDVVFHMGGLQFIKEPGQALSEALRVARPGGIIWMVDEAYSIPSLVRRAVAQKRPGHRLRLPGGGVESLLSIVPPLAVDIHTGLIANGELYILSFRKKG